jgi:hypothetical protein
MRSLMIHNTYPILCGGENRKNEMGWTCGGYGRRGEVCKGFGWGNLMERDHGGDPDVNGRIKLRGIFRKRWVVGTGWSRLRIGTGGGHLSVR